ncbi:DNA repair protein RAD51 [Echinococcus granulosus]|uniref:DNA repair protein RAD51 homolog 3 n=1 Tax=Echinococcus granulosus TaxID=6210 RepID=W6UYN6_ECHGR|nr:DNA repair protein RAD51 [Echinococcus granulosus]EUB63762.1 DNA repair protein RAD51 [Echinococcus granulosus]
MDRTVVSHIKCESSRVILTVVFFQMYLGLPYTWHIGTIRLAYLSMLSDPDFRELVMLPLPTSVLRELSRAGYSNVGEISGLTIEQIESVCKIPKPRAASIATIIQEHASLRKDSVFTTNFPNKNLFYPRSALQMLHPSLSNLVNPSEFRVANVLTMSKSLQTCLTVQIPQWCGGLAGEAIFLDTEGSFIPKRLHQMAVELVKHCQTMLAPCLQQYMEGLGKFLISETFQLLRVIYDSYADAEEKVACLEALSRIPTEESLLSKVHYIRCTGYLQLLAAVQRLGEFCKYHPNIRLIIVDSIALPFRYEFEDIPQRNRLLAAVAQSLLSTASAQNAAVIMTNQITTKFVTSETSATTRSTLVPALGESWGHICSVRLLLSKAEGSDAEQRRTARLLKHPGRPPGTAAYQVTAGGIRDCF